MLAHRSDLAPEKLNLALLGFREDDSRIFVPPTARQVERQLHMKGGVSHEALPIEGYAPFIDCGLKLGYGKDGTAFREGRVSLSTTYLPLGSAHILLLGCCHTSDDAYRRNAHWGGLPGSPSCSGNAEDNLRSRSYSRGRNYDTARCRLGRPDVSVPRSPQWNHRLGWYER